MDDWHTNYYQLLSNQRDKDTRFKNYESLIISNQIRVTRFKKFTTMYQSTVSFLEYRVTGTGEDGSLFTQCIHSPNSHLNLESAKGKPERLFHSIHKISESQFSTLYKPQSHYCPRKTCAESQLFWKREKEQNVVTATWSRMGQKGALLQCSPSTAQWFLTSCFCNVLIPHQADFCTELTLRDSS